MMLWEGTLLLSKVRNDKLSCFFFFLLRPVALNGAQFVAIHEINRKSSRVNAVKIGSIVASHVLMGARLPVMIL